MRSPVLTTDLGRTVSVTGAGLGARLLRGAGAARWGTGAAYSGISTDCAVVGVGRVAFDGLVAAGAVTASGTAGLLG